MLRSELLRLFSSRATIAVLVVVLAEAVLGGLGAAFLPALVSGLVSLNDVIPNATQADQMSTAGLSALGIDRLPVQASVVDLAGGFGLGISVAALGVVVLGALSVTGEYRRGSIVSSVLAQPSRVRLLITKTGALTLVVLGLCVPLAVIKAAVLIIGLTVQDTTLSMSLPEIAGLWSRGVVALVLLALVGMGLGHLVRSSVAGLVIIFGMLLVESSLRPLSALVTGGVTALNFLPFGLLADAVRGPGLLGETAVSVSVGVMAGLLALFAWAAVVFVAGAWRFVRRDMPMLT